jgi:curved DNA-binding protein CbpA
MGNNLSLAAHIPDAHVRIYRNILQIQSPTTRLQMLETLLSGQEYVASVKQAGLYGPVLSYISSIRRGEPAVLPGERANPGNQQLQQFQNSGNSGISQNSQFSNSGPPQNSFVGQTLNSGNSGNSRNANLGNSIIHKSGDPGDHTKAITFFSQCLQILGLQEEVALNEDALKAAYKKASFKAHPDKGGSEQAFDQVTRAYAYLGEILRRVRGGRNEMVNVSEESPARLVGAREQNSEQWKMAEPVKLNPKSLNMNLFNKVFEETRLPDPDGDGYGDWLKDANSNPGNSQNSKFNGKFNRSVFNEAFEQEIKSRNSINGNGGQGRAGTLANRQPEALTMAPNLGIELGRERPEDFTGANLNGLKYTDLKKAYTEESTFSHQVSDVRVQNKSFDSAAQERKAAPAPLSNAEMEQIQEGERRIAQRQAQQLTRIEAEDRRISEHFAKMQRYVITNN